ncbi:MAG: hypothetical protein OEU26_13695, partial [Candidatus Tectomicrobia bacterium]|nr:hypothetical protein [Candidatus Tectomicrobia bacterium]
AKKAGYATAGEGGERTVADGGKELTFARAPFRLAVVSYTEIAYRDVLLDPEFRRTLEDLCELQVRYKDDAQHLMTDEVAFYTILDKEMLLLREADADNDLIQLLRNESIDLFRKKRLGLFDS